MQDLIQDQELEAREYLMKSILLKGKVMGTAGAINPGNGSELGRKLLSDPEQNM